jgi:hypothetical protein
VPRQCDHSFGLALGAFHSLPEIIRSSDGRKQTALSSGRFTPPSSEVGGSSI